jgi:hypothetical protein
MRFALSRDYNKPLLKLHRITAENSYVDVNDTTLHFKFGWWFDQVVARRDVVEIDWSINPWLSGVFGDRVALLTSLRGAAVEVHLRHKRWMRIGFLAGRIQRIAVELEDPEGFMTTVQPATPSEEPPET